MDTITALASQLKDKFPKAKITKLYWDGKKEQGVVLVDLSTNDKENERTRVEFVTWVFGVDGDTYWGDYLFSLTDGLTSYNQRVGKIS